MGFFIGSRLDVASTDVYFNRRGQQRTRTASAAQEFLKPCKNAHIFCPPWLLSFCRCGARHWCAYAHANDKSAVRRVLLPHWRMLCVGVARLRYAVHCPKFRVSWRSLWCRKRSRQQLWHISVLRSNGVADGGSESSTHAHSTGPKLHAV